MNFYIQQWCELIIPYESIFINQTWDWGLRKRCLKRLQGLPENFQNFFPGFSKWASDSLWAMTIKSFLQQGSQDKWYFCIYMFTSIFFLNNIFFLHKTCYYCKQQFNTLNHYSLTLKKMSLNKSICKTFQSYFSLILYQNFLFLIKSNIVYHHSMCSPNHKVSSFGFCNPHLHKALHETLMIWF